MRKWFSVWLSVTFVVAGCKQAHQQTNLFSSSTPRLFSSTPSAGILAPSRSTDWSYAGIPGGIPSRTTICANVLTSDTTAQIQSKMDNCPVGQVVQFSAGTFNLSSSIYANKGIVLRGAGPTNTIINLNGGNIFLGLTGTGYLGGVPSGLGSTNWTGGLTKGSTVLTLQSTAGMKAGQRVVLDQHNASYVFPFGISGQCSAYNSCGRNDNPLGFYGSDTRAQQEMVEIQSIDSPTQMTIKPPGVAYDHIASLAPQAFYWNTNGAYGPGNITYAGVENLKINANSTDFAISMPNCDFCWVQNVAVTNVARTAVYFTWSFGDEVRDSYFSATNTSGGPTQYGIETLSTTFTKIENNIFYGITSNILPEASYGTVVGYNFTYNTSSGNEFASIEPHLAHNHYHLYEGNSIDGVNYDNVWGSSSHNTTFRNRMSGNSPNKYNYRVAYVSSAHSRYMNVIGNVLGDPTYHTVYTCDDTNLQSTDNYVFDLGFSDGCGWGISSTYPYDTVVKSSLMRWGNWDAVTYKANGNTNGVRWCTGPGAGNSQCTESETANSDPAFPGLTSPSQALPDSFYLAGKPAWFGNVPFPAIGPDVNCTANCIANTANHAAKIPAQLCYENSPKDSGGFLTAFDASTCYGTNATPTPSPTPTPTPTSTPTPTPSPSPSPTPSSSPSSVTADFNTLISGQSIPNDYPIAGFSWSGFWSTPPNDVPQFATVAISTTSASATSASVTLPSGYTLSSVQAANGDTANSRTVSISCSGSPTVTVTLAAGGSATINTNWVNTCNLAQFSLSGGWSTDLDNMVFNLVSSTPAPTPAPTPTPIPAPSSDTQAPVTSITFPVNGAIVSHNTTVSIAATATDNVAVTKVEFYVNGTLTCTDTASSYTCAWKVPRKAGKTYNLQVKAYDQAGNIGSSNIVTVKSQ